MIFLLGATGYVGHAYQRYLTGRGIPFRAVTRQEFNGEHAEDLLKVLGAQKPSFLICAAGYTGKPNVDACELHKTDCLRGNAVLPGRVREACEAADVPWGYVSSGCIFTGTKPDGGGFREEDVPNFSFRANHCSFYSGTKALGEELLDGAPRCYIWRLRIPFNEVESPRNYLTKLMRYEYLLEATNSLSQLDEFVRATFETWEKRLDPGIYNVTNPGRITTHEAVALIEKSGVCRKPFKFFKDETEFMARAAKTPRSNCVLDSGKLARGGVVMRDVYDAVEIALKNWHASH